MKVATEYHATHKIYTVKWISDKNNYVHTPGAALRSGQVEPLIVSRYNVIMQVMENMRSCRECYAKEWG